MAVFIVSNANDSGAGSLRAALDLANANVDADTIRFAGSLAGQTITLTSGALAVTQGFLTIDGDIDGDGDIDVTLVDDAEDSVGHLRVLSGAAVTLNALAFTGGSVTDNANGAGSIVNQGVLTITASRFENNTLIGNTTNTYFHHQAGAILNQGGATLSITETLFANNSATASDGNFLVFFPGVYGANAGGHIVNLGALALTRVLMSGGTATGGDGGAGGSYQQIAYNGGNGGHAGGNILNYGSMSGTLQASPGTATAGTGGPGGSNYYAAGSNGSPGQANANILNFGTNTSTAVANLGTFGADMVSGILAGAAFHGLSGDDTIGGNAGSLLYGGGGDDVLTSRGIVNGPATSVFGGLGNDTIINTYVVGGTWDGGGGVDTLDLSQDIFSGFVYDLGAPSFTIFGAVFSNFENVIDTSGGNTLTGSNVANRLDGRGGADTLNGLGGNDTLLGGADEDTLFGGTDNDRLSGGADFDQLYGQTGTDTAVYSLARSNYALQTYNLSGQIVTRVIDTTGTDGTDVMTGIERLEFNGVTHALNGAQSNRVSNINGSRFDSVVFFNDATGQVQARTMQDGGFLGVVTMTSALGANWNAVDTADFNADGRADIILQNAATGVLSIGVTAASGVVSAFTQISAGLSATFKLVAVADMDGDTFNDLVVQSTVNGLVSFGDMTNQTFNGWTLAGAPGAGWTMMALGDVNGDGRADYIFQQANGRISAGLTGANGTVQSYLALTGLGTAGWTVKDAADINRDGFADVIIRNNTTGAVSYVNMANGAPSGFGNVTNLGVNWDVRSVADTNNDGDWDVVIQNTTDGSTRVANMENGAFLNQSVVSGAIGSGWFVV